MGREIELKIPLSQEQYDFIKNVFCSKISAAGVQFETKPQQLFKKDEYYTRFNSYEERIHNNEAQCIRLRTESENNEEKSYFTIKRKTYKNGVELNEENETFVENAEVLRKLFSEASYHCWFKKEKQSCAIYCHTDLFPQIMIHAELVIVNELLYLEIEITDETIPADKAMSSLEYLVKLLNLNPDDKDSRSWKQIIQENQKKN